jgi:hypothetical protein
MGAFRSRIRGLAAIARNVRTDDWLAKVISERPSNNMAEVAAQIRDRATEEFSNLRVANSHKRHAFQDVGFFDLEGRDGLVPGVVVTDNAIDHKTEGWLDQALPSVQGDHSLAAYDLSSVRTITYGSEPMDPSTLTRLNALFP